MRQLAFHQFAHSLGIANIELLVGDRNNFVAAALAGRRESLLPKLAARADEQDFHQVEDSMQALLKSGFDPPQIFL
jgi:hypothetical protein